LIGLRQIPLPQPDILLMINYRRELMHREGQADGNSKQSLNFGSYEKKLIDSDKVF
jgi:hypothetical protein